MGTCHHQASCLFSWHSGRPAEERGMKGFTYFVARQPKAITFVFSFLNGLCDFQWKETQENKHFFVLRYIFREFQEIYCFPTAAWRAIWRIERNFLLKTPGRHCALPVAYLSKVAHQISRCLKKTPVSAFTPILHSHISFSHPLRLPFHFLLHCRYCKVNMACFLFIYENRRKGNVLPWSKICLYFEDVSEVTSWTSS